MVMVMMARKSGEGRTYVFVLGDEIFKELRIDFNVVPALLEAHAIDLARFYLRGRVRRIHLFRKNVSKNAVRHKYFLRDRANIPLERSTFPLSSF